MTHTRRFLLATALTASLAAPTFAQQTGSTDHGAHHPPASGPAASDHAEGEVRKVDKPGGKITLRHGEIKDLDMPPMTMVFGVSDAAMLDMVKQGDKVRFRAASQEGRFTIMEIEPTKQ